MWLHRHVLHQVSNFKNKTLQLENSLGINILYKHSVIMSVPLPPHTQLLVIGGFYRWFNLHWEWLQIDILKEFLSQDELELNWKHGQYVWLFGAVVVINDGMMATPLFKMQRDSQSKLLYLTGYTGLMSIWIAAFIFYCIWLYLFAIKRYTQVHSVGVVQNMLRILLFVCILGGC